MVVVQSPLSQQRQAGPRNSPTNSGRYPCLCAGGGPDNLKRRTPDLQHSSSGTLAHPIESNEQIQHPLTSPPPIDSARATSRGAITESAALTQENIPSLVQQVLQALPGATTHNNNAGDHHPPYLSISGSSTSIKQSSQPPPSEL